MILPPELYASIVFILAMADLFTTRYALTMLKGEVREINPVVDKLISTYGFKGLGVFKSVLTGAVLISIGFIVGYEILWLALVVFSSIPPVWNTYIIRLKS